jgi:hypothetical protein
MTLENLLERILTDPSPDDLWLLHPHLLALDLPEAGPAREMARMFYCYLSSVRSKLTSKQYSLLAAALAASSVGVIALQDVVRALAADRAHAVGNLLAGGLAETLETLSTFQHVKAWETEFASVHDEAVWNLYAALWQLSTETQPDLPFQARQVLIDSLLAPVRDSNLSSTARMAVSVRLFQLLLAIRLAPLFAPAQIPTSAVVSE